MTIVLSRTRVGVLALSLAAWPVFPVPGEDTGVERETRTYPLSDRGALIMAVPAAWHETVDAPGAEDGVIALNLQYESDEPFDWAVVIRAFWNADRRTAVAAEEGHTLQARLEPFDRARGLHHRFPNGRHLPALDLHRSPPSRYSGTLLPY